MASRFGKKFVDELTPADVNDYLAELYYKKKLSYRYVEGFLKMFYLFFGQAYSRNYMDVDTYNKLCVNKSTKITMPKLKADDDTDIITFSQEELLLLDTIPYPADKPMCSKIDYISTACVFAEAIRRIYEEVSISNLFD